MESAKLKVNQLEPIRIEPRKPDLQLVDIASPGRFVPVKYLAWRPTPVDVVQKIAPSALGKDIGVKDRWAY